MNHLIKGKNYDAFQQKKSFIAFGITLLFVAALFAVSIVQTNFYNNKVHHLTFESEKLLSEEADKGNTVSINAVPRSSFKSLENAGEGALYHHERYDGNGYPEGKKGEDIPLIARIICVADSYDAMNTNRVYRAKLSKEELIREIETNKGKQFDPEIADIMLGLIKNGKLGGELN